MARDPYSTNNDELAQGKDRVYPPWWKEDEVHRARAADQVSGIVRALGGTDVVGVASQRHDAERGPVEFEATKSDDFGDMAYLFRKERILVRDTDLGRVREVLPDTKIAPDGIDGLTTLVLPSGWSTLETLDRVDKALGAGVVYPDHVVHVTIQGAGACPATEPLPTSATDPFPTVETDPECSGIGIEVAVVDTGFDPKLAGATPWLQGVDGEAERYDPSALGPYAGHGTFAAGVLRARAPKCGVFVHSFLPNGGAIFESDIIAALRRALARYPDVVSMSAGTFSRGDLGMLGFRVLWEKFAPKGCVLVAAAGNNGTRKPFFPAADTYAVGVGALDADGRLAAYSNRGRWVDCFALGSEHVNAFPKGRYVYEQAPLSGTDADFTTGTALWSGTSFATPLVAGVITARMTWSGENGQQAAQAVLAQARANARVGIGAVVEPRMGHRSGA